MKSWVTLGSKIVFNNRWFKIRREKVRLPTGKILSDFHIWDNKDVVLIVPVTKKNEFLLVKQYRQAARCITTEFPLGTVEQGEELINAAARELAEETGYTSSQFIYLHQLTNNASKEKGKIHIVLAKNVVKSKVVTFDESEVLESFLVDGVNLMKMIDYGEIFVSCAVAAAYMAIRKLGLKLA